jgi:hypothetical protein
VLTTTKLEPVQEERILGTWSKPDKPDIFNIERHEQGYRVTGRFPEESQRRPSTLGKV